MKLYHLSTYQQDAAFNKEYKGRQKPCSYAEEHGYDVIEESIIAYFLTAVLVILASPC